MSRATRILGRTLVGAGAIGLALGGSTAVGAVVTDAVYVLAETRTGEGWVPSFGTASKTDAALTALPEPFSSESFPSAAELVGEVGYAIISGETDSGWATWLLTWNPDAGAITGEMQLSTSPTGVPFGPGQSGYFELEYNGLDSLADGTLRSTLCLAADDGDGGSDSGCYVVTLGTDGSVAVVADITFAVEALEEFPTSLATDPTSGTTWVFLDAANPFALPVTGSTSGTLTELAGIGAAYGPTSPLGADFDSTGALWIAIEVDGVEDEALMFFPAGTDLATTEPANIGFFPGDGVEFVAEAVLTLADLPPGLPGTGSTIAAAGIAIGGVGVLVVGAVLLTAGRHRSA